MRLLDIALSQVGTTETPLNDILYNTWYYGRHVNGAEFPWCCVFISWCAYQANINQDVIPRTASVRRLRRFYEQKNLYKTAQSYTPKQGDILFKQNTYQNHAGLVFDVTVRGIVTIEGNVGSKVILRAYTLTDNSITGYATPQYKE